MEGRIQIFITENGPKEATVRVERLCHDGPHIHTQTFKEAEGLSGFLSLFKHEISAQLGENNGRT